MGAALVTCVLVTALWNGSACAQQASSSSAGHPGKDTELGQLLTNNTNILRCEPCTHMGVEFAGILDSCTRRRNQDRMTRLVQIDHKLTNSAG